jgi:hypothetical protein
MTAAREQRNNIFQYLRLYEIKQRKWKTSGNYEQAKISIGRPLWNILPRAHLSHREESSGSKSSLPDEDSSVSVQKTKMLLFYTKEALQQQRS